MTKLDNWRNADGRTADPEPVVRLLRYAGTTMRTARNPNITAREAIVVGDWMASVKHEHARLVREAAERERSAKLRTVAAQVLRDMQAQGVLLEWQTLLDEALKA